MNATSTTEGKELVALGDGFGAAMIIIDPTTGEFLGEMNPLPENATADQVAAHVGPRMIAALARRAALNAEEEAILKPIQESFARRRKQNEDYINFLTMGGPYFEVLRSYANQALEGKTARSLRIGLLKLGFHKKQPSYKVAHSGHALTWAKVACPQAVKRSVSESVLVSQIPDAIKEQLLAGGVPSSGIEVTPGIDVFSVEIEQPKASSQGGNS